MGHDVWVTFQSYETTKTIIIVWLNLNVYLAHSNSILTTDHYYFQSWSSLSQSIVVFVLETFLQLTNQKLSQVYLFDGNHKVKMKRNWRLSDLEFCKPIVLMYKNDSKTHCSIFSWIHKEDKNATEISETICELFQSWF